MAMWVRIDSRSIQIRTLLSQMGHLIPNWFRGHSMLGWLKCPFESHLIQVVFSWIQAWFKGSTIFRHCKSRVPEMGSRLSTLATCGFGVRTSLEANWLSCPHSADTALKPYLTKGTRQHSNCFAISKLFTCSNPYCKVWKDVAKPLHQSHKPTI